MLILPHILLLIRVRCFSRSTYEKKIEFSVLSDFENQIHNTTQHENQIALEAFPLSHTSAYINHRLIMNLKTMKVCISNPGESPKKN